jgi:SAM-dependent methyltransferase
MAPDDPTTVDGPLPEPQPGESARSCGVRLLLLFILPLIAAADDDAPFVPTPQPVVVKMLEMAGVKQTDVVFDLGCGDGRVLVTAAKTYGCKAYGCDIDPQLVKKSQENAKKNGVEKLITVEEKDMFKLDLSGATVLTLYVLPSMMEKLKPQVAQMKAGSRIVAHDFPFEGIVPDQKVEFRVPDQREHTLYLYTVPLKKK